MLFHNILKHHICLLFSSRKLLLIFLVFYIIFAYNSPLYCADINVINKSLNKNEISAPVSDLIINGSNEVKVLTSPKQISKKIKNLSTAIKNSKSVLPPHGLYKFETVNINKNSFLVKKPISIKPSKIKTLSQNIKNKVSKPLRIGAIKASVRIEDNPDIPDPTNAVPMQLVLTEFPSDSSFPEKMSAEEASAVDLLKKMHKAIADGESESNVLSMYITITQNYSSYQYLNALARFYFEECRLMRSNGYLYTGTPYYEAYSQLSAIYSHENTSKNAIYTFILQKCDERKKQIEDNNSQIEKEIKYIKWSLDPYFLNEAIRRIEAKEYTESPYYSNVPTEKTFWAQYNVYLENYRKLIKNYLLTRNFNEASKAMAEYEKFYANNIKRFHTVKYYKDNDTLLTKQIEIFRDAEEHLNFIRQYVALVSYQAEVNQENDLFKSEIEKYVKVMETYQKSMGSETTSSEKISDEKLELYKTHASSSSIYEQNNYYRNQPQIVFSLFTSAEGVYESSMEIPSPRDALKLWYITNNPAPLHALKMQVSITSSTSHREKKSLMEFKADSLAPYYYTKFIPNETDDAPEPPPSLPTVVAVRSPGKGPQPPIGIGQNIINNQRDTQKESLACFNTDFLTFNLFYLYTYSNYFFENFNFKGNHNITGYSMDLNIDSNKKAMDAFLANNNIKQQDLLIEQLSKQFLMAGGAELIVAQPGGATKMLRNQSDWFIINSHGVYIKERTGAVSNLSGSVSMKPNELICSNGTSLYDEDIDVLILSACHCLEWVAPDSPNTDGPKDWIFSKGWHKALPNGVILGYHYAIDQEALKLLYEKLKERLLKADHKLSPQEIIDIWFETNAQIYGVYKKTGNKDYMAAGSAVAVYNNLWQTPKINNNNDTKFEIIGFQEDPAKFTEFDRKPFSFWRNINE